MAIRHTIDTETAWDILLDSGVSDETLEVITNINGYSVETLLDVLYAVFGLRDFEDLYN